MSQKLSLRKTDAVLGIALRLRLAVLVGLLLPLRGLAVTLSLGLLRSLAVRGWRSTENAWISSFQLLKHFGPVLRVHQVL